MSDSPFAADTIVGVVLPDDYLIAVGKVSAHWGALEAVVDLALARLSGIDHQDPRGAILTAHMTWPLKMDILESLAVALTPTHPHLSRFAGVKPLLKKAQEGRNWVAHGQWIMRDGQVHKLRYTARGKLKTSLDRITIADIGAVADDIGRAGAALLKAVFDAP